MPVRPGPVIVTGANSGFGLESTLRFATHGWEVWGTVRSKAKAKMLDGAARAAGVAGRVHPLVLDVSDHDEVVARWPSLPPFYAVVNNAGYSEVGAVEEVTAAQAKRQLDVNLVAPAVVSACALPAMRERGSGRIVMVSSIAGRASILPMNGWYHASKHGLEALSDVLRMEVASFGVKVIVIEPGFFKTQIEARAKELAGARAAVDDSPYHAAYARMNGALDTIQRFAPPAEAVARVIVRAVETARPSNRYLVGADAQLVAVVNPLLPRSVTDRLARAIAGT